MAVLLMFINIVVTTSSDDIPSSNRLTSTVSEGSNSVLNAQQKQFDIRHLHLENLHKFSQKKEEKLSILRQNKTNDKILSKIDANYGNERKHQKMTTIKAHKNQINRRNAWNFYEKHNETAQNSSMQQKSIENDEKLREIRERRLRFYKAFRSIQNLNEKHNQQITTAVDRNGNKFIGPINDTMITTYQRKNERNDLNDPTNTTYNDWETFISDYSKLMPHYNNEKRRSASAGNYELTDTNNVGKQLWNAYDYNITDSSGYLPQVKTYQSFGAPGYGKNQFNNQQTLTSFNTLHETAVAQSQAYQRLSPPSNPGGTEASIHMLQVYPSQQPKTVEYQHFGAYPYNLSNSGNYDQRYGGYPGTGRIEQPSAQLVTNDYEGDLTYPMESFDPSCGGYSCEIAPTDDEQFSSIVANDERCNSPRLKQIILQNIVGHDAESSKRLINNVCENELGMPCNVICGTGFYSYIARATQFCLASSLDVSCYAFVPTCMFDSVLAKKRRARRQWHTRKNRF